MGCTSQHVVAVATLLHFVADSWLCLGRQFETLQPHKVVRPTVVRASADPCIDIVAACFCMVLAYITYVTFHPTISIYLPMSLCINLIYYSTSLLNLI